MFRFLIIFVVSLFFWSCQQNGDVKKNRAMEFEEVNKEISQLEQNSTQDENPGSGEPIAPIRKIKVVNKFPHDPSAYTQGLFYYNGYLYESTGLVGASSLRKVDIKTGKVIKKVDVKGGMFAEGAEVFNDKIYQLTWTSGICLVYDLNTFSRITEYGYSGEGWGLTRFGNHLIMSNGTNILKYLNPENFAEIKSVAVKDNGRPVYYLNEMELIENEIWANVYGSNRIARIDPESGAVNSYIDLSALYNFVEPGDSPEVLNGIAYDSKQKRIFVTGKYWKFLFEIEIIE